MEVWTSGCRRYENCNFYHLKIIKYQYLNGICIYAIPYYTQIVFRIFVYLTQYLSRMVPKQLNGFWWRYHSENLDLVFQLDILQGSVGFWLHKCHWDPISSFIKIIHAKPWTAYSSLKSHTSRHDLLILVHINNCRLKYSIKATVTQG